MKKLFFMVMLCACSALAYSQNTFTSGQYTSSDGNYTVTINKKEDGNLEVVEPNKTTTYYHQSDGSYKYLSAGGIDYRIAIDSKTAKMYHANAPGRATQFSFSGAMNDAATAQEFVDYKKVAEKYQAKMKTDAKDAQMYSFCAAAAIARASFNNDGYEEYARKIAASLKQILVDKDECPCKDAISDRVWRSVE